MTNINKVSEKWKKLKFAPEYEISDRGRLRSKKASCNQVTKGALLSKPKLKQGSLVKTGNKKYRLYSVNGKKKTAHSLVLETFICDRPLGHDACHLNDNSLDNRLKNLVWGTRKDNMSHAIKNGLIASGEKHYYSKLTPNKVIKIRKMSNVGMSQQKIAETFHVHPRTICSLLHGETWRHVK